VAIKWREIRTGKKTHPGTSANNNRKSKSGCLLFLTELKPLGNYALTDRIVDIVVMTMIVGLFSLRQRAIGDGI